MRALVTGGAGFIGSHVAAELCRRGYRVTVLDDLSGGFREHVPVQAKFVEGSITDAARSVGGKTPAGGAPDRRPSHRSVRLHEDRKVRRACVRGGRGLDTQRLRRVRRVSGFHGHVVRTPAPYTQPGSSCVQSSRTAAGQHWSRLGTELPTELPKRRIKSVDRGSPPKAFEAFAYVPGVTDADSPIEHALEEGKGVCQDFAHVMIAICRSWGIPAR